MPQKNAIKTTNKVTSSKKASAPKSWKDGLCNCLSDFSLCCSVCFCQCNTVGQLYQKMTKQKKCFFILLMGWIFFIGSEALCQTSQSLSQTVTECHWTICYTNKETLRVVYIVGIVGGIVGLAGMIWSTYFICKSRQLFRQRDRIEETNCVGCEDCCVSLWCGCCALIQMLKQEDVDGVTYRACSTDIV